MKTKILLTGGSGLIGSYFVDKFSKKFGSNLVISPTHRQMDITNLDSIKRYFDLHQPESVIHFAAFRDATEAEKQRGNKNDLVWKVNVEGSKNISKAVQKYNCYLIHISTDYVFSGSKKNPGPYSEKDEPRDSSRLLSWYGFTKREAERVIQDRLNNAAILRICNITRPKNDPRLDYIGKILWLYDHKKIYPMFDDQYLTLTFIPTLVDLIIKLLKSKTTGVFHVSTKNIVTPQKLANYLIEQMYGLKNEIRGISINSYLKSNPRRYPKFGGLMTDLTEKKLGLKFKTWQEAVNFYLKDINKKK